MQMAMLMAAMTFTACQNSDLDEVTSNVTGQDEIVLDMIHPHGTATRATETAFENSDKVGVYVTAADAALQLGGNEVNNELFTYNGSVWTANRKVYWNEGKHNVYAYYPYSETVNDVENYSFSVQEDQSTAKNFTFSDFKYGYFKLLSDDAISEIIPTTDFVKDDSTFTLKLNVKLDDHPTFSFGGGLSTSVSSQLYGSVSYSHIGEVSESYLLEGQFGRSYNNAQLTTRVDMAIDIPMSLSIQVGYNNMNYFRSGAFIFSSDKFNPAVNKTIEFFGKLNLSRPFLNNYKAVFSVGAAHHKDYYSQNSDINFRNFKYDCNRHNIFGGSIMFTGYSLNALQYPTSGKWETIRAFIGTENDLFRPQNVYDPSYHSIDRSWLQVSAHLEHYKNFTPHFTLGTLFEAYYSSRNFSSNYQASVMQAYHFRPTPNSKFVFDPDFVANSYFAVGIKPIWVINSVFHLRSEFYAFQPTRPIINLDGQASYGKPLTGTQFMGELNFVAQYQRISLNAFVDVSTSSNNASMFGVTLGILMPNEWFLEY